MSAKTCIKCGISKPIESMKKGQGNPNVCKECDARIHRERTDPEKERLRRKRYYHRNRERQIAKNRNDPKIQVRFKVRAAILAGKVVRPSNCPRCGAPENIEGHHKDYSKPLELEWLCRACHKKEHRKYA